MKTCTHHPLLKLTDSWRVSEPRTFWRKEREVKESHRFAFPFRQITKFFFILETDPHSRNWVTLKLACNQEVDRNEYDCYLWVQQNGDIVSGDSEVKSVAIEEPVYFCHNGKPFQLQCRIIIKTNCPLCQLNQQKAKEVSTEHDDLNQNLEESF
ncbi:hypothetical protein M3Y98_00709800 [Aphelenchoides besseyi]|nr:hypothetical protein M3Y98_00709800 [Aphelenchoides besseyi]